MRWRPASNGSSPLPLLQSEVIPAAFSHGFTARRASGSAPDDTFNLALRWGDEEERVLENRTRLLRTLGSERLFLVNQVHGAAVARVGPADRPETIAATRADALITDLPDTAIGVFVADCVPVLLADPDTGACAAVHAGWRGVVAQVVSAAIRAMGAGFGTRPDSVRAALGPAIGRCCFEVGPEVVAAFAALPALDLGEVVLERPAPARPHIDLRRALRRELEAIGVPAGQIDEGGECTRCDPEGRFFSFRRDGRAGQQMALILRRATSP